MKRGARIVRVTVSFPEEDLSDIQTCRELLRAGKPKGLSLSQVIVLVSKLGTKAILAEPESFQSHTQKNRSPRRKTSD